jgi:ABC-type oligopeptide transport system ATPase subunit
MDLKPILLYVDDSNNNCQHAILESSTFTITNQVPKSKFLYPICLSSGFPFIQHTEIPEVIFHEMQHGNCLVLLIHPGEGYIWYQYKKIIKRLQTFNKIKIHDNMIMFATGNPTLSTRYKSVYYNFWEPASFGNNIIKEKQLGIQHIFKDDLRPYKFISLNRICHPHRFAVAAALYPYQEQGLLSFVNAEYSIRSNYRKVSFNNFAEHYPDHRIKWGDLPEDFKLMLPPQYENPENLDLPNPVVIDSHADKFYHSYLHIVCETFVSHVFFSEKTYKPIKYFQPFVLINGQYSLQYFRDMGYQTFSGYIDESYDLEPNTERRIELAIQASLDFINRADLHEIMKEMYPIFKHNHDVFVERCRNFQDHLHSDISKILNTRNNDANQN